MPTGDNVLSIDSNIILHYLTRDQEELWAKADAAFARLDSGEISLHCDPMVLGEVVWTLHSFYKLPPPEISVLLEPLLKAKHFRMPNKETYIRALELYGCDVPHFGDACACAAALEDCGGRLLSFDKRLSKVEGISRVEEA